MQKISSHFTDKMDYLFQDIIASLGHLPMEQRSFLFGYEDEEDMEWILGMAGYITMEYIKYSFDYADPEYSLRHFRKENDTDDERMLQSRTMKYVLRYKKREIDLSGDELLLGHKFADVSMDAIGKKIKGHRLTEMNYFEHQNIHNLDIIKSIVENRIGYAKKVSNTRFLDIFSQYDAYPVIVIGKKHRLDIIFQLTLRIIMIGQKTRQILVFHITDAICRRDVSDQFLTAYIHQSGELAFSF